MSNFGPCTRDCPKRAPGCGAACEAWKEHEEKRNAGYEKRQKAIAVSQMTAGGASNCRKAARAKRMGREHLR